MSQTFNILGEDIVITPQMKRMLQLQNAYRVMTKRGMQNFDEEYDSTFQCFEDWLEEDQLEKMGKNYVNIALNFTGNVLENYFYIKPNERSLNEIREYCDNLKIAEFVNELKEMYEELYKEYQEQSMQREIRRGNTPQFSGGGFGLIGALKGAFQAELLNIGINSLNSIANSIGNVQSENKIRKELDDLFTDPQAKRTIKARMFEDMGGLYFVAHDIINREGASSEKCLTYGNLELDRAHDLYLRITDVDAYINEFKENLNNLVQSPYAHYTQAMARKAYADFIQELKASNTRDDIREILKIFPFKFSYFKLYFDRIDPIDPDIKAYAELCGFDVSGEIH